jgi:hypothetical protein
MIYCRRVKNLGKCMVEHYWVPVGQWAGGGADSDEKDISIAAIKNKYKKNKKTAM